MPINQEEQKQGFGQRLWDVFTKPANSITTRAERRQARTLSAFLFVFALLTGVRVAIGLISGSYLEEPGPFINIVVLVVLLFISYGISRTKYNSIGSGLAIVSTIITVYLTIIFRGDFAESRMFSTFMWLIPALILGSAFFSWRTTLVISAITLGLVLAMPFIIPVVELGDVIPAFSIIFVVSILIVVVNRFRDQLETDRRFELDLANQELNQSRGLLEQRVDERTQALQLATEISRVLSQITNLDELLETSAETIRAQFDLYYVQIYLTDQTLRSLTLQTGTGSIGQELARRGHQLTISVNSINGLAVSEKRSVVVADTAANLLFRPNALLPRTRSEMAVPLIIGEHIVGVLDMQSDVKNALSADNLPAFEALAGQLAVAIENARLLAEADATRAEIESFTRRITREGWDSYLDAINRPQFMGYSYGKDGLAPLDAPLSKSLDSKHVAQVSINVIGESVGAIEIEAEEDHDWSADDLDLIQLVATQVGQQVEQLRSLDEAAHYRSEAEQALRRVTHEAWLTYEESPELKDGFAYDQVKIESVTAVSPTTDDQEMLHHNLSIHGEAVGELAVAKSAYIDENYADELVTAVADQLVTHMESLRLSEQTENALADSQRRGHELLVINRVVGKVSQASGMQDSMQIIVDELVEATKVDQVRIALLDDTRSKLAIIAEIYDATTNESALGLEIPLAGNTLSQTVIDTQKHVYIQDTQTSPDTENIRDMLSEQHIKSFVVMPIIIDNVAIGTVGLDILDEQKTITDDQIKLAETLILQAATAIQKVRLFEQTQARAEELAVINDVAQIVAQETNQIELLKAVHNQIQRIMVVDAYFVALYHEQENRVEYPFAFDNNRVLTIPPETLDERSKMNQVLQTAKPILLNWTQEEITKMQEENEMTMVGDTHNIPASLIFVPLLLGQEVLGVLTVQAHEINAYDQSDVDLISGIANHVALSLENTRLLETTQQAAEREQVLREISATINTSIDAESVLQTAAREIGRALGIETYVYLAPDINTTKPTDNIGTNDKHNGNGTKS